MRFILQLVLIFVLAYVLELFFPWYVIAIAASIMGYTVRSRANFLAGFLAIALLWTFKAWMIDSEASAALTERVARIFSLENKYLLFVLTACLGGLVGGFAALSGAYLRPAKKKWYEKR
jgi:hypothetical protein